jgi:hypothetical protein
MKYNNVRINLKINLNPLKLHAHVYNVIIPYLLQKTDLTTHSKTHTICLWETIYFILMMCFRMNSFKMVWCYLNLRDTHVSKITFFPYPRACRYPIHTKAREKLFKTHPFPNFIHSNVVIKSTLMNMLNISFLISTVNYEIPWKHSLYKAHISSPNFTIKLEISFFLSHDNHNYTHRSHVTKQKHHETHLHPRNMPSLLDTNVLRIIQ